MALTDSSLSGIPQAGGGAGQSVGCTLDESSQDHGDRHDTATSGQGQLESITGRINGSDYAPGSVRDCNEGVPTNSWLEHNTVHQPPIPSSQRSTRGQISHLENMQCRLNVGMENVAPRIPQHAIFAVILLRSGNRHSAPILTASNSNPQEDLSRSTGRGENTAGHTLHVQNEGTSEGSTPRMLRRVEHVVIEPQQRG